MVYTWYTSVYHPPPTMTKRRNRQTITIQLTSDDADLLAWVKTIPGGGRNQAVKSALRDGLNLPHRAHHAPTDLGALIARMDAQQRIIDALQPEVGDLRQQLAQGIFQPTPPVPTIQPADIVDPDLPSVSEETLNRRAKRFARQQW